MSEQEEWHRLGRISLDANSNTNYLAREFKKANLNNPLAKLVRLVFRANHVNSHNLFNQVGIISIAFYGEPADLNRQQPQVKNEVDVATFNRLKELEMRKKIAVENEEFD